MQPALATLTPQLTQATTQAGNQAILQVLARCACTYTVIVNCGQFTITVYHVVVIMKFEKK